MTPIDARLLVRALVLVHAVVEECWREPELLQPYDSRVPRYIREYLPLL